MRNQLVAVTGRLAWGRDGSCWAFSTVPALPYNPAAPADQEDALARLTAVAASIPGEFAAWGLCQPWDDAEFADHLRSAHTGPAWGRLVDATMAALPPWETRFRRVYYLAVRLDVRWRRRVTVDARADVPPPQVIANALVKAETLDVRLGPLGGRASTASEIGWLVERVVTRGSVDLPLEVRPDVLAGDALAELADCELINGRGDDGVDTPIFARWCRVDSHYGRGFQSVLACEQVPSAFEAPGGTGEWVARVERDCPFPVDWMVAGTTEDVHTATRKVRSKLRLVTGEHQDTGGDTAGPRPHLQAHWDDLKDQEEQLQQTGQHGLIFSTVFTVGCVDPVELEQRVARVEELFAGQDYTLPRRLGRQKDLLVAQLPCQRYGRANPLWLYRQYVQPAGFAGAAPFCGSVGGDPTGIMFAVDAGTGVRAPLFWQAGYAASINQSPTVIVGGELGSGKSFAGKEIACDAVLAAGGQVLGFDFTESKETDTGERVGEWVALAPTLEAAGYSTTVINADRGGVLLDPLAMGIPRDVARRALTGALMVACSYTDDSAEGNLLQHVIRTVSSQPDGRATHIAAELARTGEFYPEHKAAADSVIMRLGNVAEYMPAVFPYQGDRPEFGPPAPTNLDADYVIFAATTIRLPSWEELTSTPDKITRDKHCGQAILTLCAELAAYRAKATSTPTLIVMDESWKITTTPRGAEIVNELVKEGRRYNAGLLLIIQHVGQLTVEALSLAGQVMIFRCRGDAAKAAAALLRVSQDRVEALLEIRDVDGRPASGFCLWRDARGRLVFAHVLPPRTPGLAAAAHTTPVAAPLEDVAV